MSLSRYKPKNYRHECKKSYLVATTGDLGMNRIMSEKLDQRGMIAHICAVLELQQRFMTTNIFIKTVETERKVPWFILFPRCEDTVNLMATVLLAAMFLKYKLKEENTAKIIEIAVSDVLDHKFRTRDMNTSF